MSSLINNAITKATKLVEFVVEETSPHPIKSDVMVSVFKKYVCSEGPALTSKDLSSIKLSDLPPPPTEHGVAPYVEKVEVFFLKK